MGVAEKAGQVMLTEIKHKVDAALAPVVRRGCRRGTEGLSVRDPSPGAALLTSHHPGAHTTPPTQNLRAQKHREPESLQASRSFLKKNQAKLTAKEQDMRIGAGNVIKQARKWRGSL